MSRLGELKKWLGDESLRMQSNNIEISSVLGKMSELEALPIVEVEVPEEAVIDGHCSKFCPLQYGEDGWSDCKYNLNSTESIHQSYCKPRPQLPSTSSCL